MSIDSVSYVACGCFSCNSISEFKTYTIKISFKNITNNINNNYNLYYRIKGSLPYLSQNQTYTHFFSVSISNSTNINGIYEWNVTTTNVGNPLSLTILNRQSNSILLDGAGVNDQYYSFDETIKLKYDDGMSVSCTF